MNSKLVIQQASINDAKDLVNIYQYYVENTAITFEYETPSVQEFSQRIERTLQRYPYIVAKLNDKIVGYAYASAFHPRKAYQWNAEISIYIDIDHQKKGIGKQLYTYMEKYLKDMGIIHIYACIATTDTPNQYLNNNSEAFHHHLGYSKVAHFKNCGYKFNQWFDMIWMEKQINPLQHPSMDIFD